MRSILDVEPAVVDAGVSCLGAANLFRSQLLEIDEFDLDPGIPGQLSPRSEMRRKKIKAASEFCR